MNCCIFVAFLASNVLYAGAFFPYILHHISAPRIRRNYEHEYESQFLLVQNHHQVFPKLPSQLKSSKAPTSPTSNCNDIVHMSLQDVTVQLHKILDGSEENRTIATEGYITHKRSFGSSLAFIDLLGTNTNAAQGGSHQPLQTLFKRQAYQHDRSESVFTSIIKSMLPGTKIAIEGVASPTQNPGEVVLLVSHMRFLKASRNPEHVKGMLQRLSLYLDSSSNSNSDGNGGEIKKTGLAIEEFTDVFGPQVNVNELKQFILGEKDADSFFSDENDTDGDANSQNLNGNKKKKIAFAKMARLIVDNLPQDEHYPSIALNAKGKQDSTRYKALPIAPPNVNIVPESISDITANNQIGMDSDDDIDNTYQSSVSRILEQTNDGIENIDADDQIRFLTVSAWVQNRRRFQGDSNSSITIVELVEEPAAIDAMSDKPNRLTCVLHPNLLKKDTSQKPTDILPTDAFGNLMSKGSKVLVQGYLNIDDDSRPKLWVTKAKLQRSTWRPATIKYFLDLISGSNETGSFSFDIEDIARALDIGHPEAKALVETCKQSDATERQWRAAELSRELQDSTSRTGRFTDEMKAVLKKFSMVREEYQLEHIEYEGNSSKQLDTMPTRRRTEHLRKSSEGSRWRRKKKPQLEIMAQQVKEVVKSHPDFQTRALNILDVGGGRGYLSNYLSSVLGNDAANVHVIDIDGSAVRNGKMDAQRRGLNVRYGVGDASKSSNVASLLANEKQNSEGVSDNYDIVVALHACGALSDVALGHALVNGAGFVITPCCFRSNSFLKVSIPRENNGQVQQRLVSPAQWLGMEENDLIALTRAAEIQGDIKVAGEAIHTLCALRAKAVRKNRLGLSQNIQTQLKTFPIGFSTRNFCMVGSLEN
jgi:2-polyprenyl-3-methyl-5-hydroxy-6-metoxy-1,4-benzoquinol methylase